MSDIKLVPDENLCLVINPVSKTIAPKYKRQKAIHVAKGDHDSILVAFEMPRYVNGYDMSAEENSIQIHYANISCEDTTKHSKSFDGAENIVAEVDEVTGEEIVSFCWRVSANATKYAGTLSVGITFERYEEIEGEVREIYSWSTAPYGKIIVCNSMDNTEEAIESAYSYLIETCDAIVSTMLQEAIDSGKLDGVTPHIGENGNWFIGEHDTGAKADVTESIRNLEDSVQNHNMFINSEMPHYLGELRDLVNNAPKDADGSVAEMVAKEKFEELETHMPKDKEGNLLKVASQNNLESVRNNLDNTTEALITVISDIGVINEAIIPNLPKDVNGKIIEAASKTDIVALKNEVETFPKIGKVFYDAINDKEFIKSSIAYVGGITSTKTYIAVYDNRTEDGTATFGDAPCKSGILFHYQTMSNVIMQTLYGNDSRVYHRIFFTDISVFKEWSDTWKDVEDLDDRVKLLKEESATKKALKESTEALDKKLTANILKGSASGTIVSMKDVSPIEHTMGVKARRKNLLDLTNVYNSTHMDYRVEGNKLIIKRTNTKENQFSNIYFNLGKCKDFSNKTLTISATNESATIFSIHLVRFDSKGTRVDYVKLGSLNGNKTTTYTATVPDNNIVDALYCRLVCQETTVTDEEYTISNIQIEEGTVATAYAPYIPDISQAKILKQGKNLLDVSKPYILANGTYTETNGTVEIVRTHESRAPNVYIRVGKATDFAGETFTFSFTYAETNGTGEGTSGIDYYMGTHANSTFTRIAASSTRAVETRIHISGTVPTDAEGEFVIRFNCSILAAVNEYVKLKDIQVEVGTTATDYEPYIAPTEYDITANGTVPGVKSIHPSTTLYSDTSGVIIDVDYNRDINIAFKQIEEKITALSAAMI